ncbi:MAG: YciI family protein [Neomegalonema sp.]|nr:YciI family protein [Neomegalonema sp.]
MLFAIICKDKPDHLPTRLANREAHVAWLKASNVLMAGPFLAEDGETMNGSLLVVEAEDLAAATAWAAQDPYKAAGLFESVEIRPWKKVLG